MLLKDIKPYEKNAKKHPEEHIQKIANSIKEFGMNQPIVVDKDGVIIVGHGRYEACKLLGIEPEIKIVDLDKERVNAYRLADNKLNESEWNMALVIEELKGLSEEMVDLTGFDKSLLDIKGGGEEERPEIEFTEELFEENNYLVLKFKNNIDWLNLLSLYPLVSVKSLDSKEGFQKIGVGRVVDGIDFINKIKN